MWHPDEECQLCDMFECLWHWGLNIDPDDHDIIFYPGEPDRIFGINGEAVCTCTLSERCGHCIDSGS